MQPEQSLFVASFMRAGGPVGTTLMLALYLRTVEDAWPSHWLGHLDIQTSVHRLVVFNVTCSDWIASSTMPLAQGVAVVADGCLLFILRILPFLGFLYLTSQGSARMLNTLLGVLDWRRGHIDPHERLLLACILAQLILFLKIALFANIAAFDNYKPTRMMGNGTIVGWWVSWADGWAAIEELRQR